MNINKSDYEKGLEQIGSAIASTNGLATKLDETLKTITSVMTNIARQECETIRIEVETNLAHQKREYSENFYNNQARIEKLESQIRSINNYHNLNTQTYPQTQPISTVIRDANNTLYRPASSNLHPSQPVQYYNHHHYEPQQTTTNLHSSLQTLR